MPRQMCTAEESDCFMVARMDGGTERGREGLNLTLKSTLSDLFISIPSTPYVSTTSSQKSQSGATTL